MIDRGYVGGDFLANLMKEDECRGQESAHGKRPDFFQVIAVRDKNPCIGRIFCQ